MADRLQHSFPSVREKTQDYYGQSFMISRLSRNKHNRSSTHCSSYSTAYNVNVGSLQSPLQLLTCCLNSTSTTTTTKSGGHPEYVLPFAAVVARAPSENATADSYPLLLAKAAVQDIAATSAATPFKRIKLLIQSQNELLKAGRLSEPYKGIRNCLSRTVKNEGFFSLWRGNTSNVFKIFVRPAIRALGLNFDIHLHRLLYPKRDKRVCYWKWFAQCMAADGAVHVWNNLCVYHLEYAYTRLATDIKYSNYNNQYHSSLGNSYYKMDYAKRVHGGHLQRQFSGLFDVYKKTIKSDGIAGLYRGFNISCFANMLSVGLYICVVDFLVKPVFHNWRLQLQRNENIAALLVQGGIAVGVTFACYPLETVAVRMITNSGGAEASRYKNSWDALTQIVKNEGAKSLFKGIHAKLLHLSVVFLYNSYVKYNGKI